MLIELHEVLIERKNFRKGVDRHFRVCIMRGSRRLGGTLFNN